MSQETRVQGVEALGEGCPVLGGGGPGCGGSRWKREGALVFLGVLLETRGKGLHHSDWGRPAAGAGAWGRPWDPAACGG